MPTLQEIRKQYPQYDDMSDQVFADKFHAKYYSDIPKAEFYKKIGYSDMPIKATTTDDNFIDPNNPDHSNPEGGLAARSNFLQGLGYAGSEIGKSLGGLIDWLFKTNLASKIPENLAPEMSPEAKEASAKHPNYAMLGWGSGYVVPAFTPLGVESKLSTLTKGASLGKQLLAKMVGAGAEGAAIGAAYNPENPIYGGMVGGSTGGIVSPSTMLLSKFFKETPAILTKGSTATSEEAKRNFDASRAVGAKMQLGQVAQNPTLSKIQSSLSYIPGSGQAQANIAIGKAVKNNVNSVLDQIKPESTETINNSLQRTLKDATTSAERKKIENFADVESHADSIDAKVNLTDLIDNAKSSYKQLTKYSKESDEFKDVYDAGLLKKLGKLADRESGNDKISFGAALALDRDINAAIAKADSKGDTVSAAFLHNLKGALNEDIDRSAAESRNKELIDKWKDAKQHFSQEVLPLRAPEVTKFTRGTANNERIIPTFLKAGQFEQPQFLNRLTRHLDQKQKQAIAHEYLTQGMREIKGTPEIKEGKVLQNYEKMGNEVKKILLTPAQRAVLDDALLTKRNMNLDLNQMVNPKTGASLTNAATLASTAALGFIPSAFANVARRSLANDRLIQFYIKQLEKKEGKRDAPLSGAIGNAISKSQAASPALIALLAGNQP